MATVTTPPALLYVRTTLLDVAYETHGPVEGDPVILLHGFPYDPRGYDDIAPVLAERGYWVLVPYLRGYGPTRFINTQVMRSGQQAALAKDLPAQTGSPGEALRLGRRWLSHLEALLKD